jgi:hypothetical protein
VAIFTGKENEKGGGRKSPGAKARAFEIVYVAEIRV